MSTHKYWRISNIIRRGSASNFLLTCSGLRFIPTSGEVPAVTSYLSDTVGNGGSGAPKPASLAFDDSLATFTANLGEYSGQQFGYFLGVQFTSAVDIKGIEVLKDGLASSYWEKCILESSPDGVTWTIEGQCNLANTAAEVGAWTTSLVEPLEQPSGNKHRYWRISDIEGEAPALDIYNYDAALWELDFRTGTSLLSKNPRNASMPNSWVDAPPRQNSWIAAHAFDGKVGSTDKGAHPIQENSVVPFWYQYDFIYPATVVGVEVYLRRDHVGETSNWQRARMYYSDDGVTWTIAGALTYNFDKLSTGGQGTWASTRAPRYSALTRITEGGLRLPPRFQPRITTGRLPNRFKPIYTPASTKTTLGVFNPYTEVSPFYNQAIFRGFGLGLFGYIRGKVYERATPTSPKTPVVKKVFLYHQISGRLVASQWSKSSGEYLFTGLSLDTAFTIISIDHTGKWGVEGVAFKYAKRSVYDGISIQYPVD